MQRISRFSISGFFVLSALCAQLQATPSDIKVVQFEGKAYSLDSGELLYSEHHYINLNRSNQYDNAYVEYKAPDGELFANKDLDFSKHKLIPDMSFNDLRSNQTSLLTKTDNQVKVEHIKKKDLQHETISIDNSKRIVADAGFDRLVIKNWERLLAGKKIKFQILSLDRSELIDFKLETVDINEERLQLSIKPKSWLIRLVMDPIYLQYELSSKRLLEYKGLTNILREKNGELKTDNYIAHIKYRYF